MKLKLLLCGLLVNVASFASEPLRFPLTLYVTPQSNVGATIFAQAQLNVTPAEDRNGITSFLARVYASTDGSCASQQNVVILINDSVVTNLAFNQTYVSTDASNFSLFGTGGPLPVTSDSGDMQLFFIAGGPIVGNLSPCIQASAMTCDAANNCGFPSTVNWSL